MRQLFFLIGFLIPALSFSQTEKARNDSVIIVRDNGLVANFYLPKILGKHPAIIVIGGSEGGIWWADAWGEPLAARGYAVLSLAYFGMEKLPTQLEEIALEYFKKAIDWVKAHPSVDTTRIAFAGNSRGGGTALLVAATYPEVKAVIAGVPGHVVWQSINNLGEQKMKSSLTFRGIPLPFAVYDTTQPFTTLLDLYIRSLQNKAAVEAAIIPVEKINGPVLLISGKDDKMWPSAMMADRVVDRLKKKNFRFPYEHLSYENAGHNIVGPPRKPSPESIPPVADTSSSSRPIRPMGGTPEVNNLARKDGWEKIIKFLDQSLHVVSAQKTNVIDNIIVLKNVRIVDGTGSSIKLNQTLIITKGKIAAMGESSHVPVPAGAKVIDLSGHTVFPGLVMMHEHFEYREGSDFSHAQPVSYPRLYLAFGVTTVRTAGTDHPYVNINLKKAIDEGRVPGPEMHLTSPYFNGDGERFYRNTFLGDAKVRTPEDAVRVVRYWAAEGMTSFKAYSGMSKASLAAMIQEVHRLKLTITAHLGTVSCSEAADLGIDNIEHGFLCGTDLIDSTGKLIEGADNPIVQALINKLIDKKIALTLTPNHRLNLFSDLELEVMHPHIREKYKNMKPDDPYLKPINSLTRAKAFARAGGVLLLGSDAAGNGRIAGFTNIRGIKSMVTGGFTLEETIKMASLNGATFLKIQNRTGSIAVGKEADLFIVKGDPSKKIEDIENVEMVFSDGIQYNPKVLIAAAKGLVGWQ